MQIDHQCERFHIGEAHRTAADTFSLPCLSGPAADEIGPSAEVPGNTVNNPFLRAKPGNRVQGYSDNNSPPGDIYLT